MVQPFVISPRIISHLGEDLIRNESIALLELVKNSYDACATQCMVSFLQNEEGVVDAIVVKDNGKGMDLEIIQNVWMVIGTANKQGISEPNEMGRYPLGEKGIGRLGVHKLGSVIRLVTKKHGAAEIEVNIDWSLLSKAKEMEDFMVSIEEHETPKEFEYDDAGTLIEIRGLKCEWSRRKLRSVYRDLTSLNSPFSNKNESFKVDVLSNNESLFGGLPNINEILGAGMYVAHCEMKGTQITDFSYEYKPWRTLSKIEHGRMVGLADLPAEDIILRGIRDKVGQSNPQFPAIDLDAVNVGPVSFDIIIFERDSSVAGLMEVEKTSVAEYLKENGGVRVYRDNVRVYDYGERDNDWLGIDIQRIKRMGGNISNNLIVGAVQLNRNLSHGLREKTNREGFIEDDAYLAFMDAVNYCLSLIVRLRNEDKSTLTNLYRKHKVVEPVLSDLNDAIQIVKNKIQDEETKSDLLLLLDQVNNQYKEVKDVLIKSANAGLNLGIVIHEIEKQISALKGSAERGDKEMTEAIARRLEDIIHSYGIILKNSSIRNESLNDVVREGLRYYEFRFQDHGIQLQVVCDSDDLTGYLSKSQAISAMLNLLDNSIFWLSMARKQNVMIGVYVTDQYEGYNCIVICDNGPGFNISADAAVKPFISGKPFNYGMGLGLHVVNETMCQLNGKLNILNANEINLPASFLANGLNKAIVALCFPIATKN